MTKPPDPRPPQNPRPLVPGPLGDFTQQGVKEKFKSNWSRKGDFSDPAPGLCLVVVAVIYAPKQMDGGGTPAGGTVKRDAGEGSHTVAPP